MDVSHLVEARQHEIQHLVIVLDPLGKNFGANRYLYYTLGQYLGYNDIFLIAIKSQKDPLSWILCSTCVKTDIANITKLSPPSNIILSIMVIGTGSDILLVTMDSLPY